ncbi:MAG: septum formation initiator family protein [bacterium]|nr:septum formation initiator family protein [bacterium]
MVTKRNRFFSPVRIIIIVAGLISILYALRLYYIQKNKLILYGQEIEKLKNENAKLEKLLDQAHTPYLVEKIAREQLGMMKKGEYRINLQEGKSVSH